LVGTLQQQWKATRAARLLTYQGRVEQSLLYKSHRFAIETVTFMPNKVGSFSPSLSAIRSEFQTLCEEQGGPVTLSETVERRTLESACKEFGFRQAWDTYRQWQPDRLVAMRHWPWVALAADQYRFERSQKAKYVDEPKPSEIL